jgi:hypothetical protein
MRKARFEDFIDRIRAEVEAGNRSAAAIGKAIGLSPTSVTRFATRAGLTLMTYGESQRAMWARKKADPEAMDAWRRNNGAAQRKAWETRVAPVEQGIPVPAWVPAELHDGYRKNARKRGEEFAASIARQQKREAMGAGL